MAEKTRFWVGVGLTAIPAAGLIWILLSDDPLVPASERSAPKAMGGTQLELPGTPGADRGPGARPSAKEARPAEGSADDEGLVDETEGLEDDEGDEGDDPAASCTACQRRNCAEHYTMCFSPTEGDDIGTVAFAKVEELCRSVIDCVRRTDCAKNGREACYCGDGLEIETCLAKPGNGACRDVIEQAADSKDPQTIAERFVDPKWPVGRAFRLENCVADRCSACRSEPSEQAG